MMRKWMAIGFGFFLLAGCGGTQTDPQDRSSIVRQVDGELTRTRSYDGVRNYGQDNVTIFITDRDGKTMIYDTNR